MKTLCVTWEELKWTTCIINLGNYIRSDLSETYEIRHKPCDFIGIFIDIIAKNHDATPEVLMQLTESYCTQLFGPQDWQFRDKNID